MSMIQNSFGGPTQQRYNPAPTGQYPPMLGMGQMPQMGSGPQMGMPPMGSQGMGMSQSGNAGNFPQSQAGSFQAQNPQYGPQSYPGSQSMQGPPQGNVPPNSNPGGAGPGINAYGMGGMGMGRGGAPALGMAQFQNWQNQRNQQRDGLTAQPATGLNSPTGQPFNFPTSPRINNFSGMGGQRPPMGGGPQMSPGPVPASPTGLSGSGAAANPPSYNPWAGISSINPQSDGSKFYPGYAGPGPQYDPNQQHGMPAGQYLQQRIQQGNNMAGSGSPFTMNGSMAGQQPWQQPPPQTGMANPFGAQAIIPQFNQQGQTQPQGSQVSQTGVFSNQRFAPGVRTP